MADLRTPEVEGLLDVLVAIDDKDTMFALLEDMFTIREIRESSQRLSVARMLDEGKSYAKIAEATGVSINTALGRMRYAILNLRRMAREHNVALQLD